MAISSAASDRLSGKLAIFPCRYIIIAVWHKDTRHMITAALICPPCKRQEHPISTKIASNVIIRCHWQRFGLILRSSLNTLSGYACHDLCNLFPAGTVTKGPPSPKQLIDTYINPGRSAARVSGPNPNRQSLSGRYPYEKTSLLLTRFSRVCLSFSIRKSKKQLRLPWLVSPT